MFKLNVLEEKKFCARIKTYQDFENFLKANNLNGPDDIFIGNFTLFSWLFDDAYYTVRNLNDNELLDEKYNQVRLLRFIIRHQNFDVNCQLRNYFGNTVLMVQISNSDRNLALLLIEDFNANPFISDNNKKNTLHLLVAKARKNDIKRDNCNNMLPVFEKILQHKDIKKRINDKDENGNTALHIAMARRDLDYIIPLIKVGADLNTKNNNGLSSIDILKSSVDDRMEILRTILSPWNDDKLYIRKKDNGIAQPIDQMKEVFDDMLQNKLKTPEEVLKMKEDGYENYQSIASFESKTFNQDPQLILNEVGKVLPSKNINVSSKKGKCNIL